MGAAAERARRAGDGRRCVPDQGPARRDRRARSCTRRRPATSPTPDRGNLDDFLARGGGLVVIHAGTVSRDPDWFKDDRRRLVAQRHHEVARGPDAPLFHRPRQSDHEGRVQLVDGRRDLLRHGHPAGGAGPRGGVHAEGRGRAQCQRPEARRRAHRRRQARQHLRHPAADVDLRADASKAARTPYRAFVSIPGHLYENFNRPNYRAHPPARHRLGRQARRTSTSFCKPDELGDALRYVEGGPTAPAKAAAKIEVHPEFNLTLVAAEPLIHKADEHRLGRARPAVGRRKRPSIRTAAAVPEHRAVEGQRIAARRDGRRAIPRTRISILTDTNGDGVMDRKHVFADKLELVTGFVLLQERRHRRDGARHLVSRGHQRRRGRRQAHEALHRPRHRRHARRDQQPALGTGRLDLRHARLQRRRR